MTEIVKMQSEVFKAKDAVDKLDLTYWKDNRFTDTKKINDFIKAVIARRYEKHITNKAIVGIYEDTQTKEHDIRHTDNIEEFNSTFLTGSLLEELCGVSIEFVIVKDFEENGKEDPDFIINLDMFYELSSLFNYANIENEQQLKDLTNYLHINTEDSIRILSNLLQTLHPIYFPLTLCFCMPYISSSSNVIFCKNRSMYLYYYILERFALGEESKKELQIYNTLDQKPDSYSIINPYENVGRPTWRMFKLHTLCKPYLPDYPISYDILESFGVYGEKITKPNIYYCNITKVHIELPTFELKKLLNFFKEDVYPIYLTKKQELIDLDTSSNQL